MRPPQRHGPERDVLEAVTGEIAEDKVTLNRVATGQQQTTRCNALPAAFALVTPIGGTGSSTCSSVTRYPISAEEGRSMPDFVHGQCLQPGSCELFADTDTNG